MSCAVGRLGLGIGQSKLPLLLQRFAGLSAVKLILLALFANDVSSYHFPVSRVGYKLQVVLGGRSMSAVLAYECNSLLLVVDVMVA